VAATASKGRPQKSVTVEPTVLQPKPAVAAGCELVRQELVKYPGWNTNLMMAIARAENRNCDPLEHNLTNTENHRVCIGSYGVLQVGCVHFRSDENRNDTATVVKVAYRVWQSQGYTAWTNYRNGAYKEFLR